MERVDVLAKKRGVWYASFHFEGKQIERKIHHTTNGTSYVTWKGLKVEIDIPSIDDVELYHEVDADYGLYALPDDKRWNRVYK